VETIPFMVYKKRRTLCYNLPMALEFGNVKVRRLTGLRDVTMWGYIILLWFITSVWVIYEDNCTTIRDAIGDALFVAIIWVCLWGLFIELGTSIC